ncbi:unnamed protein product (macronuclear) [Paramecium tetraurelia]|uniref:Anaphase-promoting complex subunit 4 WD40 domain-containing protein n=1 Tax=Paramecium tetraurelia TaxID=5888 RepID=A0BJW7_PARTE|nr:uncharacterized protein GSPATT00029464001 [Paramecium tetraurelia]CAK58834.1 unnamed protein product [Paramecium tetraurelia]|eukprot:XP_001426232.1 hypothetical protein (macronuclear) [Paramecium tetraurelia strain d4-2]
MKFLRSMDIAMKYIDQEVFFQLYPYQLIYLKKQIIDKNCMGCHIIKQNQTASKQKIAHCNYQSLSNYKLCGIFYSLAINSTSTLLVAAIDCEILIFYFKMGNLKQLQVIQLQAYNIYLLTFFKQKSFFISAQSDSSLAIWNSDLISKPNYICKLFGHSKEILCIAFHPLIEDLIVTVHMMAQQNFGQSNSGGIVNRQFLNILIQQPLQHLTQLETNQSLVAMINQS